MICDSFFIDNFLNQSNRWTTQDRTSLWVFQSCGSCESHFYYFLFLLICQFSGCNFSYWPIIPFVELSSMWMHKECQSIGWPGLLPSRWPQPLLLSHLPHIRLVTILGMNPDDSPVCTQIMSIYNKRVNKLICHQAESLFFICTSPSCSQ